MFLKYNDLLIWCRMSQPRLVIEETAAADNSEHSESATTVPALPSSIPFFLAPATADTKRSILKSNLRAYEADPVKLTPGLDPSHLSTSPIAEPVLTGPKVKFSSIDEIFQVIKRNNNLSFKLLSLVLLGFRK